MASNFIQPGDVLDFTAAGTITSGVPFLMGTKLVVPLKSGVSGDVIPVQVTGVFSLSKNTGASTNWAMGAAVYWDAGTSKVTGVVGSNVLIGYGAAVAGTADTTGLVKLNG